MNKVSLLIGGENRQLLFDFGVMEHIEIITGTDAMEFSFGIAKHAEMKKGAVTLVYAGLVNACEAEGQTHDYTFDLVENWVKRLSLADIVTIINAWGKCKSLTASQEGSGDTQ